MEFNRHISRRLHEEHEATLALWGRVEAALSAGKPDQALLQKAAAALAYELGHHFLFEERELFPRLAAAGERDIGELLREEHDVIREAGRQFIDLVREDYAGGPTRVKGLELAERLFSHVQKEEMSLVPLLEDLLDAQVDEELSLQYVTP